jgi:hypothetical protein
VNADPVAPEEGGQVDGEPEPVGDTKHHQTGPSGGQSDEQSETVGKAQQRRLVCRLWRGAHRCQAQGKAGWVETLMTLAVEFADQRLPNRSSQLGGWAMATQKVRGNSPDSIRSRGAGIGVGDDLGGGSIRTGTGAPGNPGAPAMACNSGM